MELMLKWVIQGADISAERKWNDTSTYNPVDNAIAGK